MTNRPRHHILVSILMGLHCSCALAQQVQMTILSNPAAINHYPGNDGLIGNADDVTYSQNTPTNASAPNITGSYGHNAFNFGGSTADNELPTGFNAITFVNGTITVDQGVFNTGGGPIVTALNVNSGSEPFPGHGAYTSTITAVNGGSYNPSTGAFSINVDISFLINGTTSTEPGLVLSGEALLRAASQFGASSGNAYVDSVLVPLAQSSGADSLVFMDGTGTLPNLGFPIRFVIAATSGGSAGFTINQGISGSWFNPQTAGQGFLMDVDPTTNFIFIAWFTYDDDNNRNIGSDDQRWLTAQGNYSGGSATLPIFVTSGGLFDNGQATTTVQDGSMTVQFNSCNSGSIDYSILSDGLSGTIPIQRLLPATAALCDTLGSPLDLD